MGMDAVLPFMHSFHAHAFRLRLFVFRQTLTYFPRDLFILILSPHLLHHHRLLIYRCRILSSRLINFSSLQSRIHCGAWRRCGPGSRPVVEYTGEKNYYHYSLADTWQFCEKLPSHTHTRHELTHTHSRPGSPSSCHWFGSLNSNGLHLSDENAFFLLFFSSSFGDKLLINWFKIMEKKTETQRSAFAFLCMGPATACSPLHGASLFMRTALLHFISGSRIRPVAFVVRAAVAYFCAFCGRCGRQSYF